MLERNTKPTRSLAPATRPLPLCYLLAMSDDEQSGSVSVARWIGLVGGPVAAVTVALALANLTSLAQPAALCAGVATLMAVWWLTEALPMAITALVPIVAFPLLGILSPKEATRPYGDEIVFLFLGGFLIQLAMERWGLHRRVAILTMLLVGTRPDRLIAGLMLGSAIISMWVSNAATAAMMLPIGVTVCQFVARSRSGDDEVAASDDPAVRNFGTAALIGIAWSATIGGIATPIGTAPNVIIRGYLAREMGIEISFLKWMVIGCPIAVVLLVAAWLILVKLFFPVADAAAGTSRDGREFLREQLQDLGPVKRGEWAALGVFAFAAIGWVFGKPLSGMLGLVRDRVDAAGNIVGRDDMITDAVVAITAGLLLFIIPVDLKRQVFVLDWQTAKRMPYGVLLIFGGGMSLAAGIEATKLSEAMATALRSLSGVDPLVLVLVITAACIFMSEFVSNTALTQAMQTVMGPAARALGVNPLLTLLPTCFGASCAFMMPAGTPPSAICFASGYFSVAQMARAGFVLNLVAIVAITLVMVYLVPLVI